MLKLCPNKNCKQISRAQIKQQLSMHNSVGNSQVVAANGKMRKTKTTKVFIKSIKDFTLLQQQALFKYSIQVLLIRHSLNRKKQICKLEHVILDRLKISALHKGLIPKLRWLHLENNILKQLMLSGKYMTIRKSFFSGKVPELQPIQSRLK